MLGQHRITQTTDRFEAKRLGTKHIYFSKTILYYKMFKEYCNTEEETPRSSFHTTRFQDLLKGYHNQDSVGVVKKEIDT